MKDLIFFCLAATLVWGACKNDGSDGVHRVGGPNSDLVNNPATAGLPTDTNQLARIQFEEAEFNFGTVTEGDIVNHSFKFTNVGKVPLTILKARSTCGCTIPEWPEDPIPPGGTGEITAKFNTDGKHENQTKMIMVTANTYPNESRVKLTGIVSPKKEN